MPNGSSSSSCYVGERLVVFEITIPTEFEQRTERIAWNIECVQGFPSCEGTGIWISRSDERGAVTGRDAFIVEGAEVVSKSGLHAVIAWGKNTFIIDADAGTVSFRGPLSGVDSGQGEARCADHGAPQSGNSDDWT